MGVAVRPGPGPEGVNGFPDPGILWRGTLAKAGTLRVCRVESREGSRVRLLAETLAFP